MKVLYFTKYSRKGASSRLRSYQYFPYLRENGIEVSVSPLFNDSYLENLYQGKKSLVNIFKAYCKRFFVLWSAGGYDCLIIEKELFPYLPAWAEQIITRVGIKYIVDYDDAIFHNYDRNPNKVIGGLLSKKIDKVMRAARIVVVGNHYLGERAKNALAKKIIRVPTVVDMHRYPKKATPSSFPMIIGWIGSPSTFKYVERYKGVFQKLLEREDVKLHIVGAQGNWESENVKFIPWSEHTETAAIAKFDVGIMPLEDTPWEHGKCAYKLIQYMACGLPVIASAVGMNTEVVKPGYNGFLAHTDEEWENTLLKYLHAAELRKEHGNSGYCLVQEKYSLQHMQARWLQLIQEEM